MDFVRALVLSALRIIGIFLVFLGLNALLSGEAKAVPYQDQGEAVYVCSAHLAAALAHPNVQGAVSGTCSTVSDGSPLNGVPMSYVLCQVTTNGTNKWGCHQYNGGLNQNSNFYDFPTAKSCLSKNTDFSTDTYPHLRAGAVPDCVAGCKVSYGNLQQNKLGSVVVTSAYDSRQYTGQTCAAQLPTAQEEKDKPPTMPSEECKAAGGGQTFCVKPNGDHCHTTSNGKKICWRPTETGVKHDGIDAQCRTTGSSCAPPVEAPNDGSTWNHTNSTTTTVTNSSTTTNYTVNNYTSTSSKPPNVIPNEDITTPGDPSDGEEGGTATPASNCAETPACSGGDAIGCAMLRQHHSMSCQEGSTTPSGLPDGDPESSVTEPVNSLFTGDEGSEGNGFDLIDRDGWAGSGQCPIALTINAMGRSYQLDDGPLCTLLDALKGLINLLAGIHAGIILLSGSKR